MSDSEYGKLSDPEELDKDLEARHCMFALKNEERSLKLDLFKYSSDYSHFSAMNVKHLITNWQDFSAQK